MAIGFWRLMRKTRAYLLQEEGKLGGKSTNGGCGFILQPVLFGGLTFALCDTEPSIFF
jgi:hypothetical protein